VGDTGSEAAGRGSEDGNPFDASAAQVVPLPVERIPLYHWRPGARALVVGSRDGAVFDPDWRGAEARTFRRPLDAALLATARERGRCDAVAAAWSESLLFPRGLDLLLGTGAPLIVASSGRGEGAVVDLLLPRVAAWLVLVHREPGEHVARLLAEGRHVEVLLAVDDEAVVPDLAWERARAVHLVPRRPADDPGLRRDWYAAAKTRLPASVAVYDEDQPHSGCACGARLVWRSGGASRLDALGADGRCTACGAAAGFTTE
jgi:hypothetical protein